MVSWVHCMGNSCLVFIQLIRKWNWTLTIIEKLSVCPFFSFHKVKVLSISQAGGIIILKRSQSLAYRNHSQNMMGSNKGWIVAIVGVNYISALYLVAIERLHVRLFSWNWLLSEWDWCYSHRIIWCYSSVEFLYLTPTPPIRSNTCNCHLFEEQHI